MDKEFNLVAVIRIIIKWWKPIAILTVISGAAATLFSVLFMDNWFLSWSTFYPTNQYITDRSMIFNSENTGGQIEYFGDKNDVNRLLTIANSAPIMDYIIDSFKLAEHYKIDKTGRYWRTKVRKELDKNYEAIKTEHDAVQVSIYDTDPKTASAMVNAVVEKVDQENKQHTTETKQNLYNLISSQIVEQQRSVNGFVDTLADLGQRYKIKVSSGPQGTILVEGDNFKAVQEYKTLMSKEENAVKELDNRINIKEQLEVSMKSNTSSLVVFENAFPADKKEKPLRLVIVLITMLITGFVSIIGALLIEQLRELKKQL
jgi:capsular polysaccharide biosynthesis protein